MTIWAWKGGGREKRIQEDGLSNGTEALPHPECSWASQPPQENTLQGRGPEACVYIDMH